MSIPFALLLLSVSPDASPPAAEVRQTVERSLVYLEKEGVTWIENRKCTSCHQIPIMVWSHLEARRQGLKLNEAGLADWLNFSLDKAETGDPDGMAQAILGIDTGLAEDARRQLAAAEKIIAAQQAEGSWKPGGQLPKQKRPLPETTQVSTLWMIAALDEMRTRDPDFASKAGPAIDKALAWLKPLDKPAVSHEWYVARLLVAHRLGDKAAADELLHAVLARQRDDGGWGWLVDEPSDALATGMTLYALDEIGQPHDAPAIVRARKLLLATQQSDGSWLVPGTKSNTKSKPQPTSNAWGTGWAAVGLLRTIAK
jgi:squalene-hopene/tetraprenyl-beta-curcumene cyclase